ncbi:TspO/MBR family protein [Hyphomonas sp.]|jgi:tryptophan-rich sensory protein|uniref:TspO/MBR family protein n=1 Tax=Hyphomonas sp. TaxID=87 RepID=UPI0032999751|eukprot:TRINITY_DN59013_c0_g1_i1.p1 TRINITY_DN59013_c0_g1~~TRINITY_DN59013_c0_g1_i1.p1  ORF type:complete len:163 (+),score=34.45 TRINITY_DN59013_c0_g1_i1:196-684(+)
MVTSAKAFPWGAGILLLLATVTAAAAGAVISGGNSDPWYDALNKPVLTPPDILFVLVWPALFVLMAAGALLVLERAGSFDRAVSPLGLYYTMLAFNAGWSLAFFGMNEVALALGVLVALWLLIVAMMQDFWRYSHLAALLQLPYLAWVSFAGYLNAFILFAN